MNVSARRRRIVKSLLIQTKLNEGHEDDMRNGENIRGAITFD
jgi:hypothetical protein